MKHNGNIIHEWGLIGIYIKQTIQYAYERYREFWDEDAAIESWYQLMKMGKSALKCALNLLWLLAKGRDEIRWIFSQSDSKVNVHRAFLLNVLQQVKKWNVYLFVDNWGTGSWGYNWRYNWRYRVSHFIAQDFVPTLSWSWAELGSVSFLIESARSPMR